MSCSRPPAEAAGEDDAFRTLRERTEAARAHAWGQAVEHVSSADFAVFLDDVAAAAEGRSWLLRSEEVFKTRLAIRAPVMSVAARMLDEHLVKARKRGRHLKSLSQRDCHRLRISLKKLRYAAEFLRPALQEEAGAPLRQPHQDAAGFAGALNDVAQVRATLSRLTGDVTTAAGTHADLCFAAGIINGWHRAPRRAHGQARAQALGPLSAPDAVLAEMI